MYANKERAQAVYPGDNANIGRRLLLSHWRQHRNDRGAKYYILGSLLLTAAGGTFLYNTQSEMLAVSGLAGGKLKQYRSRLTVVFDLDETIVSYGDKAFRLKAGMVPRPYLAELLDYLSEIDAEVIVWAASSERYVKQVLQVIDPLGTRISKFIVRSNDWFTNDRFYEKNLFWLKRDMDSTIMIENRAMSIRNCNANAILVEDFLRGEFMDDGKDFPPNDNALKTVKEVVQALEESGMKVSDYLSNPKIRHNEIKEIPCHLAINQLPDEIARGVFFYIGDKYKPSRK